MLQCAILSKSHIYVIHAYIHLHIHEFTFILHEFTYTELYIKTFLLRKIDFHSSENEPLCRYVSTYITQYNPVYIYNIKKKLGIYVVTNLRKNSLFRYTEFELSNLTQESIWVKLRRSREKPGTVFELVRKVIAVGVDDRIMEQILAVPMCQRMYVCIYIYII